MTQPNDDGPTGPGAQPTLVREVAHSAGARDDRAHPAGAGDDPARSVVAVDDRTPAREAWRLACDRRTLLWQGDYHNARQLLRALAARLDRGGRAPAPSASPADAFFRHRQQQAHRARVLNALHIPLTADHAVPLRRAPDVRRACDEAYGTPGTERTIALRELLGVIGAHEWRKNGVAIPALGDAARIHPHYGVFSPVRGEYVDLVAKAPLPSPRPALAFDIGTGTGVLAAVLARRGVDRIVATDADPRAIACAADNLQRLGYAERVELRQADLFADGTAPLVVCNPPWVPARAHSPLDHAVYDEDSRMLRGFLAGLPAHLAPGGEGWLVLSDLAVHLGLRTQDEVDGWIAAAGLRVLGRLEAKPLHRKAGDAADPLHAARSREVTSLWRLGHA